jgi:hypothetical protein
VVAILVVYSIVYYDPTLDPFSENPNQELSRPNPIDMVFYNAKKTLFRPRDRASEGSEESEEDTTLGSISRKLSSGAGRDIFIEASFPITIHT